jgi:hypothetical protein
LLLIIGILSLFLLLLLFLGLFPRLTFIRLGHGFRLLDLLVEALVPLMVMVDLRPY